MINERIVDTFVHFVAMIIAWFLFFNARNRNKETKESLEHFKKLYYQLQGEVEREYASQGNVLYQNDLLHKQNAVLAKTIDWHEQIFKILFNEFTKKEAAKKDRQGDNSDNNRPDQSERVPVSQPGHTGDTEEV